MFKRYKIECEGDPGLSAQIIDALMPLGLSEFDVEEDHIDGEDHDVERGPLK